MTGVLKTILILIVFYYAWKLMFRLLFPVVIRKAAQKAQDAMNDRMRNAYEQQRGNGRYQEGDIVIQKGAEKTPKVAEDDGEYVEFEEVKN